MRAFLFLWQRAAHDEYLQEGRLRLGQETWTGTSPDEMNAAACEGGLASRRADVKWQCPLRRRRSTVYRKSVVSKSGIRGVLDVVY